MAHEIERKRLNYMQAYIKYYDDGSQILQSYTTDVVKRTPSGKYIRLWKDWSPTTNKHVSTYCGHRFRSLPFEDGTVEDTKPVYKRKGYKYDGRSNDLSLVEVNAKVKDFINNLKKKNLRWMVQYDYNSACNKELKKWAKSEKRQRLVDALYSCATKKPTKNAMGVLAKLYDFDINEVWNNSLIKDFGPIENA